MIFAQIKACKMHERIKACYRNIIYKSKTNLCLLLRDAAAGVALNQKILLKIQEGTWHGRSGFALKFKVITIQKMGTKEM